MLSHNALSDTPDSHVDLVRGHERIWLDEQKVLAVRPKPSFVPYFQNPPLETAAKGVCKERERRDSNPRPPT